MYATSAHVYDALYRGLDYAGSARGVHEIARARGAGRGTARPTLLDVGCGTGTHLARFAEWYEVAGVDLAPEMAAIARAKNPGVPIHVADMRDFDLARRFDVVVCLFSAVAFVRTTDGLRAAVAHMAHHLAPGGVLAVERWFGPGEWKDGHLSIDAVDDPGFKLARMARSGRDGLVSWVDLHYQVLTPDGLERFDERLELGLFEDAEYADAFAAAGLRDVETVTGGLAGRGLVVGTA
jgi:SAM-dependent methyltransferase